MRRRLAEAPVGHLATASTAGTPHVVPCCFAVDGDVAFSSVDDIKPKSTLALRRLTDIQQNPVAALLVDHYDDDWSKLWWVRVEGPARVAAPGEPAHEAGVALLMGKYDQYLDRPPPGPMVVIEIDRWRAWGADPSDRA